jgi:malate dehydrogenase (oxaloacetate-decarboxylating)(NADP+)
LLSDAALQKVHVDVDRMSCSADPLTNKGTAFSRDERLRHHLDGLLPPRVESLQEQAERVIVDLRARTSPLDQYRLLAAIQSENDTLFNRVVLDHLEELLPIIYTPTVGQACLEWSRIYVRPRGLYLSAIQHRGRVADVLRHWPRERVGMIVVTDGGRILGLGDLGANGMGIPIGKLALYTACAGVAPELCLPVTLDVGTDNERLRNDPLYLGERVHRMTGEPYDALLDEFVAATQAVFPGAVLQFEDFNDACAFRLLRRYRDQVCCFNDDVQGTGAMGLAGVYAAGRITKKRLAEQRILFVGAGEACLGIGSIVAAAMQHEGLSESEAKRRCLYIDSKGVVEKSRADMPEHKQPFAQDWTPTRDLIETMNAFEPTVLVGACGQNGLFTRPVLEMMARLNDRPIVFALSNPTSKAECTAEQAYAWTDGRAVFASGSPFAPVAMAGRIHTPGQANNCYIFPGVGLGLLVSGAQRVTDAMFFAAARALADQTSDIDLRQGRVFPPVTRMRDVALAVAIAVAAVAYEQGLAAAPCPPDLHTVVRRHMYSANYA